MGHGERHRRRPAYRIGWLSGAVASSLYAWLGLTRFASGWDGNYDVGIFTQAAKSWAALSWPYSDIKGGWLLGDHFHPITVVFGVAYALWPDPRAVILAQSLALGAAVGLITGYAVRRLGPSPGVLVGALVTLAHPLVAAAKFEVHEVALGAPIIAALAIAVERRRFRAALVLSILALTIKEDVGLLVVMVGAAWWLQTRERRPASVLALVGGLGFLAANAVVLAVNAGHRSQYLPFLEAGASGQGAWSLQRLTPVVVFLLLAGLGLRAPVLLLGVPTLVWRVGSDHAEYWSIDFHYDVLIGAVALVALVGVLANARPWRRTVALMAAALVAGVGLSAVISVAPWRTDPRSLSAQQLSTRRLVASVPAGSAIVADQSLGPDLVPGFRVRMLGDRYPAYARWVVLLPDRPSLMAPRCAKRAWLQSSGGTVTRDGSVALVDLGRERRVELAECVDG